MSDEHEHDEDQPFHLMPFGPSQEMIDMHNMAVSAEAHATHNFFLSLDEEQLVKLRGLLQQLSANPHAGIFYQGIVCMILADKFGHCAVCGVNHDDELKDLSGQDNQPEPLGKETVDGAVEQARLMNEYGLEWVKAGEGPDLLLCKNCKMPYASLADRMLRAPGIEGCHGCIEKEKWG